MGVSLHTSTSGLDLPMKVLDMFGCEVPVCAMNFACLHELVQDGVNGRVFDSIQQLSEQLNELLKPLADDNTQSMPNHSFGVLQAYSEQLKGRDRWSQNWTAHALPVIIKATANQD
jgi:beta-1,4-mannosyltransferase